MPTETITLPVALDDAPPLAVLSKRQQSFVLEYLVDFNMAAAAVRCGYKGQWPERWGLDQMHVPEVAAAVKKGKELLAQFLDGLGIDKFTLLRKWTEIATADIRDFVEFTETKIGDKTYTDFVVRDLSKLPSSYPIKKLSRTSNKDGEPRITIELESKVEALSNLSKIQKLLTDEGRPPVIVPIQINLGGQN